MIVVTGAAGFIGSAVIWALNQEGNTNILAVDHLADGDKWLNLRGLQYVDYMEKELFLEGARNDVLPDNISAVIHLGANTSTAEEDASLLMENNCRYSQTLAGYCLNRHIRFIYASAASTYGDGSAGFDDKPEKLELLRPLNKFAFSKHSFDMWAYRNDLLNRLVGVKFANVFGPNEYHKEGMRSMVTQCFEQIERNGFVNLYKSHTKEFGHGEQTRDFIYIKDAVSLILFLLRKPELNGLFNAGTGTSVSWNELAAGCFSAMKREVDIRYIDMPENMRNSYQHFTCLNIGRIRRQGFRHRFKSVNLAIQDYYSHYYPGRQNLSDIDDAYCSKKGKKK